MEDDIRLITINFSLSDLKEVAKEKFGDMVKAVVDVEKEIMAIGGELHADEEGFLLARGSKQEDLWGINLYVDLEYPDMVEFDSMINIRPRQNNRSQGVEDELLQKKILGIVQKLIGQL